MTAHDPVLTAHEVADELRVAYRTVLGYLHEGRLAGVKQGKRYFVRRSALDAFLEPRTQNDVA